MQSPDSKHLQVPQKEKQDAITKQQASSSAIERKARCNYQAASILNCHRKKNKMQSSGSKHPQLPQKEKTRCNHRSVSIFKCHRKKSKMQSSGSKHPQVPQKEKQDAITGLQASSSAIERKTRYNCLLGIIFKIWKIQVEDAFVHS